MNTNRRFLGLWIPAEIWLNKNLSLFEKCLYSEIESLSNNDEGVCYASNKHLSEFFDTQESRVSAGISNLINKDYVKLVDFDGRIRKLKVTHSYKRD